MQQEQCTDVDTVDRDIVDENVTKSAITHGENAALTGTASDTLIQNGVYYIKYNNKYLTSNLSLASTKNTSTPQNLPQLWKIKYLGDGLYSIRTMYDLGVCISQAGMELRMYSEPTDDISSMLRHSCWKASGSSNSISFQSVTYGGYLGVSSNDKAILTSIKKTGNLKRLQQCSPVYYFIIHKDGLHPEAVLHLQLRYTPVQQ